MNKPSNQPPPPGLLARYLKAHGWRASQLRISELELFTRQYGNQTLELIVPKHAKVANSSERVRLAIDMLAALEERQPESISNSIDNIGFDLTREKVDTSLFESVRLSVAEKMISKTKRLVIEAAKAEYALARVPNFANVANQYADQCRFGHTFKGSFGFTIKTPVGVSVHEQINGPSAATTRERAILQRIIRGVTMFSQPDYAKDVALITNPSFGFTAGMLDDLAALLEGCRAHSLTFDFELSPELVPDEGIQPRSIMEVPTSVASVARDMASDLRRRDEPTDNVISGFVTRLATSENPADLENLSGTYEVALEWLWQDRKITVRVPLSPVEYRAAYEAHGRYEVITVEGKLEKAGNVYLLRNARLVNTPPSQLLVFE